MAINIENKNIDHVLKHVKNILNKNKIAEWFPNINFLHDDTGHLLWSLSKAALYHYPEAVKCELLGYNGDKTVKFVFIVYPNIMDGCCGCPPLYSRNIEIINKEWYLNEVPILEKTNTVSNAHVIKQKINECCQYLKANMEWYWTDIELDILNKDYDEYCKKHINKVTRKERLANRYHK